jgi:lysophospholipase L1-like esterase
MNIFKMLFRIALVPVGILSCTESEKEIAVTNVWLNESRLSLYRGLSDTLTAGVSPDDAKNKGVTWESSNPEVATVSHGIIKALDAGQTIITASAGNQRAICVVTVTVALYPLPEEIAGLSDVLNDFAMDYYPRRIETFKDYPLTPGDVVFLGNSITEQGNWSLYFRDTHVRNRGIGGDQTDGVLLRLQEIIHYKASVVYLMIGVNDLDIPAKPETVVAGNIREIVRRIKQGSPNTRVVVQTILPMAALNVTLRAQKTNEMLKQNAPGEYELIDTYAIFTDPANNGCILPQYVRDDGRHLTEAGYQAWVQLLQEYNRNNNINF